jgi:hypothetical protein
MAHHKKDYADPADPSRSAPKKIDLDFAKEEITDRAAVERKARRVARSNDEDLVLVSWWDEVRQTGGPEEACKGEVPKCVTDYATSHGGEIRVSVNNGKYEFFYLPVSAEHAKLDRDQLVARHKAAITGLYENVQGG